MAGSWHQARLDHRTQQSEGIAAAALALILEHGASALTMAAIAAEADVSRQTLYRYYSDIDAVLVGVAELLGSHDDSFEARVFEEVGPSAQLDIIIQTVAHADGHGTPKTAALRGTLPPQAREVLARHEHRVVQLLVDVLRAGVDDGAFRDGIEPSADAPLILGLAAAANPHDLERAIVLVHRLVDRN